MHAAVEAPAQPHARPPLPPAERHASSWPSARRACLGAVVCPRKQPRVIVCLCIEGSRMASTDPPLFGITGATGGLGSGVARALTARGQHQRLIVRDPGRAPTLPGADVALAAGYHDRVAMTNALR